MSRFPPSLPPGLLRIRRTVFLVVACALGAAASQAQMAAMVAVDASTSKDTLSSAYVDVSASLGKATGQSVRVDRSSNFADVLRSTRTGEYDIYIVPGHVAASALSHGYMLVAAADKQETFVMVTKPHIKAVKQLVGARLYLAQQDSIQSYMAKGLLNESGVSIGQMGAVQYRSTSGAGLIAVKLGVVDATVTRRSEFEDWARTEQPPPTVLLESKPVPAGLTLLVRKSMNETQRERLLQWAVSGLPAQSGMGRFAGITPATASNYKYLGGLGNFTPVQLPGVTRVTAVEAAELIRQGAQLADVRSDKEFSAKRIPGAVLVPYVEKSTKDIGFDGKLDDFSAVKKLDKAKPTIFACNGAECWKSYKASKVALGQDFKKVYWLRGGLPEWEEQGLPLAKN